MTEAELIKKIQELKQIKPSEDWVVLAKRELFLEESHPSRGRASVILDIFPRIFQFQYFKPALATFVFLGIMIVAAFGLAQNALPGDSLYSLKRISEEGRIAFVSEINKPKAQLELANKRLEELTKVAEAKQTAKLAPAIEEFQASVSQAAKNLKEPKKITKEIVEQTKKLEENKQKIEALGILIGETKELDNALSQLVETEIIELETLTLSEEKAELLSEAKVALEEGNFSDALEKILLISNQ